MAVCIFSVSRQSTTVRVSWYAIDGIDGNGMERRGNGKLYTIYAMHILVLSISVYAAALTGPRKMPFICCCLALYIECCRWLHDAAAHKKQLTLYRIS